MLELNITSPYLIKDSEVQLSIPIRQPICPGIFSKLLKNGTTNLEKGEYEEGEGKGWELTLCLRLDILWIMVNPMPELTLTQLHSWLLLQ